ncbi:winged helix-turn-helix transcriptional regulator [Ktedonobacter robiniae]|uniref:HTH-type transcriptional regulator YdeP n=1 Tax=Ktedonobacter robiniae TaxID=2778365 RepID=A0ABQ3UT15_9CHLR|nr:helix-turn-helix domain-containing protein [Ktedonobacter robiniae]GHO55926.1 putative HTH-type transcriptional regulator YdeP [Ktedonobacter robiniae]
MQQEINTTGTKCYVEKTVDVMGGKWKPMILHALLINGPRRFGELNRLVPEATQRILTLQLRELEEDGVIHREVYKQVPPKVEYSLTPFGLTLEPILVLMRQWGERYADSVETSRNHSHNERERQHGMQRL